MTSDKPKNPSRRRFLKGLFFGGLAALVFPYGIDYGFRINAPRVNLDLEKLNIEPVWPDIFTVLYVRLCIKGTDHCWLSIDGIDASIWKPYGDKKMLGVITNAVIGGYIESKEQLDALLEEFHKRVRSGLYVPKFLADNYTSFIRRFTHDGHYVDWEVYAEEHKKADIPLASIVLAKALEIIHRDKAEWGKYHLPSILILYFLAREGNFPAIVKEAIRNKLIRPEFIKWYVQELIFEQLIGVSPEELKALLLGEIQREGWLLDDLNLKSKRSKEVFTFYFPHPFTYFKPPHYVKISLEDIVLEHLSTVLAQFGSGPAPINSAYAFIVLHRGLNRNAVKVLPFLHHILYMHSDRLFDVTEDFYTEGEFLSVANWKDEAELAMNKLFFLMRRIGIPSPLDIYRYILTGDTYTPYAQNVIKLSLARGWYKALEATMEMYKEEIENLTKFQENSYKVRITESIKYGEFRFPFRAIPDLNIGWKIAEKKGDFSLYFTSQFRNTPNVLTYAYAIAKLALKDQP